MKNDVSKGKKRLKSKKEIEKIFNTGKVLHSSDKKIRAHYLLEYNADDRGISSAVAVSHKAGKAVWRNRVKRLLREADRLSSCELANFCIDKNIHLEIVFSANALNETTSRNINLKNIKPSIEEILKKVNEELRN